MKARKILVSLAALALVAAISIGGTLAYLTSQATVENTFTVGNIKITLDEARVNQDGVAGKLDGDKFQTVEDIKDADRVQKNTYKLMPGHTYTKDPTIHVEANSENSYIFVKVENGISKLEAEGTGTIAAQLTANGWEQLKTADGTAVENVYVYKDNYTQNGNKVDLKVFGSFTLADDAKTNATTTTEVNGETVTTYDYQGATITVTAYAVQMDGFETAYEAWAAAKF